MMLKRMSTFLFTLLGLTVGSSDPCAMRAEIAPCTCRLEEPKLKRIVVSCEQFTSFADIINRLGNRFPPEQDISLKINHSHLSDMRGRSFEELNMRISNLKLNFDDLSYLPDSTFTGLGEVEHFSLADNRLVEIPRDVLRKMPKIKTLELGRSRISNLWNEDFQDLPSLQHLLLPGNLLSKIESNAFPRTIKRMHIGKNSLKHLNGSLRALTDLEWLFINDNQLTTLYEQLPSEAPKLILLHAANNHLSKLPIELQNYPSIDSLFLSNNDIASLDGVLQKARRLKVLDLSHNKINALADDDFAEMEVVDGVQMGFNYLKHVNKTFLPMKKLRFLNLTHNYLTEFSFESIWGLKNLQFLDLSHNRIAHLNGRRMENVVEVETRVEVLQLEHNEIKALGGALGGIHGLRRLNLSHNKLMNIAQNDLIGLEDLRVLDISHNHLTTLQETSTTFLPRLRELIANNNLLRELKNDFHGLPVLCKAELSSNQITSIETDLISKTRCVDDGVLQIYLYDNPILCNANFNATADFMRENFTLVHGDFSICPTIIQTTETTTVNTSTPSETVAVPAPTKPTHAESTENAGPIIITPQLIINQQPVPFPVLIAPEINEKDAKKEILIGEKTPHFDILSTDFVEKSGSNNITSVEMKPAVMDGNILESVMIHTPIVVKDEGTNVTLFIPVENGAIRKDHVIDQYIQKNEDVDLLNQTKVSGVITNIDIVEIKQLPDDSSSTAKGGGNHEDNGNGN